MKKHPLIHLEGCQFKSEQKLRILAKTLDTMEKEFGIHEVDIEFRDCFVCPDIDLTKFIKSKKPMEYIVGKILITLDVKIKGINSKYWKYIEYRFKH